MTILHMETEAVRAVAHQFTLATSEFRLQSGTIYNTIQSMDWMGPNRGEFDNEISGILRNLASLVIEGEVLSQRVHSEIAEWEHATGKMGTGLSGDQPLDHHDSDTSNGHPSQEQIESKSAYQGIIAYMNFKGSGSDLMKEAKEAGIILQLPDGSFVYPDGSPTSSPPNNSHIVKVDFGSPHNTPGEYTPGNPATLFLQNINDTQNNYGLFAHELQHAIDDSKGMWGVLPGIASNESNLDIFQSNAENWLSIKMDNEIRAMARMEAVRTGAPYNDPSGTDFINNNLVMGVPTWKAGWEKYINEQLAGSNYKASIWVDFFGKPHCDLKPSSQIFQI